MEEARFRSVMKSTLRRRTHRVTAQPQNVEYCVYDSATR